LTTKLWFSNYGDNAYSKCEESLKKLGVEYVDLILLHTPGIPKEINKEIDQSKNKDLRKSGWRCLEKLFKEGKAKQIGVSNFHVKHMQEIIDLAEIKPHVNQIEYNIWQQRKDQVDFCKKNNIVVEGWGPLAKGQILGDEEIEKVAKKYNKSISQICIRWNLQHGIVCIPKSIKEERIIENASVFDWEISEEDMKHLDSMDKDYLSAKLWTHENVE